MKQIITVFILLSVVNVVFTWEHLHTNVFDKFKNKWESWLKLPDESQLPSENSFIPPGHRFTPPGHRHVPSCPNLDQLINFNQQIAGKSCTFAWICRNPQMDNVITGFDGAQIIIPNQNNCANNNFGQPCVNPKNPNTDIFKTPPPIIETTTQQTTEIPHQFGGEGLIDIRMGN